MYTLQSQIRSRAFQNSYYADAKPYTDSVGKIRVCSSLDTPSVSRALELGTIP
jgi:hypothetical protein